MPLYVLFPVTCHYVQDLGYNATLTNMLDVTPSWAADRILQGSPGTPHTVPNQQPIQIKVQGQNTIIFSLTLTVQNVLLVQITPIDKTGKEICEKVRMAIQFAPDFWSHTQSQPSVHILL